MEPRNSELLDIYGCVTAGCILLFVFHHHCFCPASGHAMVTDRCRLSPPPMCYPSSYLCPVAHKVQQFHCSSIFVECCYLTLSLSPAYIFLQEVVPATLSSR